MHRIWVAALITISSMVSSVVASSNQPPLRYGYWNVPTELIDHLQATVSHERLDHECKAEKFSELDTFISFVPHWEIASEVPFLPEIGLDPKEFSEAEDNELVLVQSVIFDENESYTFFVFVNWELFGERSDRCRKTLFIELIEKQDWDANIAAPLKSVNCAD
ncbi:hypothetical protein FEE96_18100 [Parasedimentitalea maritima]|uniref:Uncharacterized protein n=1 Tax=Parasedimentitalea maritima TaxID=2578117 RepID=A0ABY2URA0_9RHOB|nr:hypothetical protein [Zongyanglinia marina]TLP58345.1 hypothetical protein FEE96_18100 [Zongyanglinia marina]